LWKKEMKSSEIFKNDNSVQKFFDDVFDNSTDVFRILNERVIWRNILYYSGEQYLEYLPSSRTFRRRQTPYFIPTPVSNEIREFVRSTNALLSNQKMIPRVWPNTSEREDREASELGENLMVWMDQSHDAEFFDELERVRIWICVSGTGFIRAFPDANGGQWLTDGEEIWKTGDVGTRCIIPFNVRLDQAGDTLQRKRWAGVMSLEDPEWVEDTFKVKIEMRGEDKTFIDYQKRLTKLVANVSPWKGQSLDMQSLDNEDQDVVLFKELEFRPTLTHPNGQYFISCGGKIIYKRDRMPIKATQEEWYYSLTDFHYNYIPGRFWSDAAVNDLISPQNTINEIDQALAINRKGMARPLIFTPGDVGLKKVEMGGRGFNLLSYNPIMGQKPVVENGTPLPVQVLEERKFQKQQMQDSGGDPKNILRGASPSAQSSGVQLDMLRETVERGKAPDIDRYNRSLTKVYKKRLLLAQEIYTEERILKITGRGNEIKIRKFKAADLRGNTDVRLELDSGLLATKAGQTQVLLSMLQFGVFGDLTQNPDMKQELFKRFGMASFSDEQNHDIERAERENMDIAGGQRPRVQIVEQTRGGPQVLSEDPLFKYDNHPIHYETHKKFSISVEFEALPDQIQTILIGHTDTHRMEIDNVKPDMRQYVQIDKMYPLMTRTEQMQVLTEIGITPDPEGEVAGLPDASKTMQAHQHLKDTAAREGNKATQNETERLKVVLDARGKEKDRNAVQVGKGGERVQGSLPKS
jgi:hypothetical protein